MWKPIRTVPLGVPVLIAGGGILYPIVASWSGNNGVWCLDAQDEAVKDISERPTHWMPLPEPPTRIES